MEANGIQENNDEDKISSNTFKVFRSYKIAVPLNYFHDVSKERYKYSSHKYKLLLQSITIEK
jgi:hypothetical protein